MTVACSADELASLLQENCSSPLLYDFDHRYPSPSSVEAGRTAVVYAELGTASFSSLHATASRLASQGELEYVLRHYVKVSTVEACCGRGLSGCRILRTVRLPR